MLDWTKLSFIKHADALKLFQFAIIVMNNSICFYEFKLCEKKVLLNFSMLPFDLNEEAKDLVISIFPFLVFHFTWTDAGKVQWREMKRKTIFDFCGMILKVTEL